MTKCERKREVIVVIFMASGFESWVRSCAISQNKRVMIKKLWFGGDNNELENLGSILQTRCLK